MTHIRMLIVAALISTLAGCMANQVPGPQGKDGRSLAVSGSRIKARTISASDGTKATIGWFDTALKMPCTFLPSGDGHMRCLPDSSNSDLIRVFYDNSDCAGDAVAVGIRKGSSPCAPFGTYVQDTNPRACNAPTVIYEAGGALAGADPYFYSDGRGCASMPEPSPTFDLYNAVVVDPATTFVEAVEVDE